MKTWTRGLVLLGLVASAALTLTAQGGTTVATTKHNLNISFPGSMTDTGGQICLPCHAPHNQPDQSLTKLWNHAMPTNTYTLYSTTGSAYVNNGYSGKLDEVSRKCLSCHDGTTAVDSFGGVSTVHGASSTNTMTAGYIVGAAQNLTHDHPVGMLYSGFTTSATGAVWDVTNTSFNNPSTFTTKGYFDTDGTTPITKLSSLSLGKAPGSTTATLVTCKTCHTPHDDTFNFLRVSNQGSQLCLTCHIH